MEVQVKRRNADSVSPCCAGEFSAFFRQDPNLTVSHTARMEKVVILRGWPLPGLQGLVIPY